jgi:hypothetical protein
MHFHGDRQLDVHFSKEDQAKVLQDSKAGRHHFAPEAGWVTVRIRSEEGLENAREVVRLAYSQAKGIMESYLARREASHIAK